MNLSLMITFIIMWKHCYKARNRLFSLSSWRQQMLKLWTLTAVVDSWFPHSFVKMRTSYIHFIKMFIQRYGRKQINSRYLCGRLHCYWFETVSPLIQIIIIFFILLKIIFLTQHFIILNNLKWFGGGGCTINIINILHLKLLRVIF